MPASFARETIVRLTYPTHDVHNTPTTDWSADPTESKSVAGCWLEPIDSVVERDGRIAVLTGWRGAAPTGTVLDPTIHHVLYKSVEYELTGQASEIPSPTGALREVLFSLRRWEG